MTAPAETSVEPPTLGSDIARLVGVIGSAGLPSSDRAALRRWALGQPIPLAFYRLWLRHLGSDLPPADRTEVWMAIVWGIATLGEGCHDPKRPFGLALAESGFAEGRLERLLSAPDDVRIDLFMSTVRFLAARGERFDGRDAAQLLLTLDADKREGLHRRIAAAYFRHLTQASKAKE